MASDESSHVVDPIDETKVARGFITLRGSGRRQSPSLCQATLRLRQSHAPPGYGLPRRDNLCQGLANTRIHRGAGDFAPQLCRAAHPSLANSSWIPTMILAADFKIGFQLPDAPSTGGFP
jgi:hypothetical protein